MHKGIKFWQRLIDNPNPDRVILNGVYLVPAPGKKKYTWMPREGKPIQKGISLKRIGIIPVCFKEVLPNTGWECRRISF